MGEPNDEKSWLVAADRLTEQGSPLGELIVLSLKYEGRSMPELKKRRIRKLVREWQERFGSKLLSWDRSSKYLSFDSKQPRLYLGFESTEQILARADELRRLGVPLGLELKVGPRAVPERCWFDEGFRWLAWTQSTTTVTNLNHSPGMDEDVEYHTALKVWRVADRQLIYEAGYGDWDIRFEFRADGLYKIVGESAERLVG